MPTRMTLTRVVWWVVGAVHVRMRSSTAPMSWEPFPAPKPG